MRSLVDFLNHGALPFTGRQGELARLLEFWRSTPEAEGLRALLLSGEAGIGKSRLLEELLPRIHREGGIAIQVKLLPESTDSIVPLIARALWYSDTGRHLLKKEAEESLGAVIAALRRLSRLRPTLLVVEDLHLLAGEAVRDLWGLLEGLADETISLLCAARPIEMPARAVLERHLVDRVELAGLTAEELGGLWKEIFADSPEPGLVASLGDATAGNPLAIRSAFRGAVASGMIGGADGVAVHHGRERFIRGLRRDVDLLSEGMAAHLTAEERDAAGRLASLGEVFARETAPHLLENSDEMINRLIFRGVLALSMTPRTPLISSDAERTDAPLSAHPLLAFTHTLLHRHFVDRSPADIPRLVEIIGTDLPLYSLLPIQRIAGEARKAATVASEPMRRTIHRIRYLAMEISHTRDWESAMDILRIAEDLYRSAGGAWSDEEQRELTIGIELIRISIVSQGNVDEHYRRDTLRLVEMTERPETTREAVRRIAALGKYYALMLGTPGSAAVMWEQIEEIVQAFPDARFSHSYSMLLALIVTTAVDQENIPIVRKVEQRVHEVLAEEEGKKVGALMRGWVLPGCMLVFETVEEFQERLRLIGELEREIVSSHQELMLRDARLVTLDAAGHVDEVLKQAEQSRRRFREYGWEESAAKCLVARLRGEVALGADLGTIAASAGKLLSGLSERALPVFRGFIGGYLAETGILRGETAWGRELYRRYPEGEMSISPAGRIMMELEGDLSSLRRELGHRNDMAGRALARMLDVAIDDPAADASTATDDLHWLLHRPFLGLSDLLILHVVLVLTDLIEQREGEMAPQLRTEIRERLEHALAWLEERRLGAYMLPLLSRHGARLTARELKRWRGSAAAIQRARSTQMDARSQDGRISIAMLGTIEIEMPGGEVQRIQGARLRAVLGLMVANQMMERPLTQREFCAIATGEEESPERARNVVYVKLHALREILGDDAVITETDAAPRLNPNRIQVDLLDAHRLLGDVRSAMRERALLRACPALLRALELSQGEVPFPGLYEEFFEAAREDFENALRLSTIAVAKELLREGDALNAGEILRRCFEAIPADEEIGELLREALVLSGKRAEAERVKRLTTELAEA